MQRIIVLHRGAPMASSKVSIPAHTHSRHERHPNTRATANPVITLDLASLSRTRECSPRSGRPPIATCHSEKSGQTLRASRAARSPVKRARSRPHHAGHGVVGCARFPTRGLGTDCRARQSFNRWPRAPIGARFTIVAQCDPIGAPGRAQAAVRLCDWSPAPHQAARCYGEVDDVDRRSMRRGAWRKRGARPGAAHAALGLRLRPFAAQCWPASAEASAERR
jgi:hypothetical protein